MSNSSGDNATKRYYVERATEYAAATLHTPVEHHWQRFTSILPPNASILDLGCGAGRDVAHFSSLGYFVVGMDYSLPLLKHAKARSESSFVAGDLRAPPFDDGYFAGVWALASLLHLHREEIQPALRRIRELLKPQGWLFATVKMGAGQEVDRTGRFYTYFSQAEWRRYLEIAKFRVVALGIDCERRTGLDGRASNVEWLYSLSQAA